MPSNELAQLRREHPFCEPRDLAQLHDRATFVWLMGVGGTSIGAWLIIMRLIDYYNYNGYKWLPERISFLNVMMAKPGFYILLVLGIVLLVVGCRGRKQYKSQLAAATKAHEDTLIELLASNQQARRDAKLYELQNEPFKLLHLRYCNWKEGRETVWGARIEFQDLNSGPRRQAFIPLHRITASESQDVEETAHWPERQHEKDFDAAVWLVLVNRPWWMVLHRIPFVRIPRPS